MGLDLNTALISDTFDGLIKTTDGNVLTGSPLVITDGRGNDSSIALATAGNGVAITGTLTVNGSDISGGLATAQADITAIEAKTDFITVTGAVNLDTINTKAGFITVTQAVDLDTIESDIAAATAKTQYITVTQAVDLDTMESDILSAKTKTDYITISQAVNLDTVESGLATAQSDITAIEAKTDFITVSSNVNLNTIASDASAAKTKTDFLTVTQPVDLDTLESDVNVAKGDITAIEAKTDNITVTQAVNLDTMESDIADAKTKTDFITITQAVNLDTVESGLAQAQTDINLIEAKTNNITVTQAVNLDTMESDIATNNAKNSYPAADATKVGFISVTQAVDLDSMETDISNLSSNKYDKTGGTISGNVVVTGDLTVNGTTTTVNTQTLSVEDPLIELANQNSANTVDTGFYANYSLDAGVTTKYAGLFKDASDSDKFKLFKGLEVEPTSSVDTAGTGYAKGDLVVGTLDADQVNAPVTGNLTGNVSGNVTGDVTGDLTGTVTATSVLADGVTATTQSAGDNSTKVATTAYVDSIVTAQDLDFAGDSGTGAVDLDSQSLTIAGTANEIETSASGQTVTIGLPSTVGITTALGVGTSSPDRQLTVQNSGNAIASIRSGNTSASFLLMGDTDSDNIGMFKYDNSDNSMQFYAGSNSSERMRIDSSGNILIGSTSAGFTTGDGMEIQRDSASATLRLERTTTNTSVLELSADADQALINSRLSDPIVFAFGQPAVEKMRITSAGNVGIGESNPLVPLHISKDSASGENIALILDNNNTTANNEVGLLFRGSVGSQNTDFQIATINKSANNADLVFRSDGGTERMRMLSTGGLTFNGDTAAANALDDYEEGTFGAALYEVGGGAVFTDTAAKYVKVGTLVHVKVTFGGGGTGGSNVLRMNLPFAQASRNLAGIAAYSNSNGGAVSHYAIDGNDYLEFVDTIGAIAGANKMLASDWGALSRYYFAFTYSTL